MDVDKNMQNFEDDNIMNIYHVASQKPEGELVDVLVIAKNHEHAIEEALKVHPEININNLVTAYNQPVPHKMRKNKKKKNTKN